MVFPTPKPTTLPLEFTLATAVLDDDHVTDPVPPDAVATNVSSSPILSDKDVLLRVKDAAVTVTEHVAVSPE